MAQADGTILIDTHVDDSGVVAGSKQIENSAKRMASRVKELGGAAEVSIEKIISSISKQNDIFAQQARKVNELQKKIEEYANQKIPTDEYKEISVQIEKDTQKLNKLIEAQEKYISLGGRQGNKTYKNRKYDIDQLTASIKNANRELQELEISGNAFLSGLNTEPARKAMESLRVETAKKKSLGANLQASFDSLYASVQKYEMEAGKAVQYTGFLESAFLGLKMAAHAPVSVITALGTSLKKLPVTIVKAGLGGVVTVFQKFYGIVKKVSVALAGLVKAKITSGLKKLSSGIFGIHKSANKASFSLGKMLATSVLFSAVFRAISAATSAVKEGMTNLAQYSEETNSSISMLWGSLETLKNSLATAFAPILSIVAPILTRFINMLSTAASYVSMFFAMLSGKSTYTKAIAVQKDYAGSLEETASGAQDAADSTNAAAEAAEDYLSPLDDINRFTEKNKDSGASGTGGVSGESGSGPLFEEVKVEPISFDSWGEAFNSFLNYLLNTGIPALRSTLTKVAEVVNTFSNNLYEMFTFPGVVEKVQLLGKEIAISFNEFVNLIDWGMIGSALGAGLNFALQFLVNLIYTFDWMNLGASLAKLLNNVISEIDWYAFGQLLWSKFKIALEIFAGFLLNLDMAELAQAASKIVIGFLDSVTETIQNIDWEKIGHQIKEFLVNLDWPGIANAVFTAIGAAFGAAVELLWGFIKDAWKQVVDWWHETAFEDGKFTIEGLLNGILDVFSNIGAWIKEHIFDPFVEGFKSVFGIHSPSTVMQEQGHFIIDGLLRGITDFIGKVRDKFTEIKDLIVGKITDAKDGVVNAVTNMKDRLYGILTQIKEKFRSIFDSLVRVVKSPINGIIGAINGMIRGVASGINTVIRALNRLSFDIPSWVPVFGGKRFGFNIGTISAPQIPYLASGAVIPPNKEFLAVLGDQKQGNNIEAPESLIRRIVREESGSGRGNIYEIPLKVGRRELAKLVIDEAKLMRQQTGQNPFELA